MGLLQTYEKGHPLNKRVIDLVEGSGDHRPFKKEKKNGKEKKVQSAPGPSQVKKVRAGQARVECFYYKKRGH